MVEKRVADTWKTKKWFTLIAPKIFNYTELGETPAQKETQVLNRTIEVSLANLTGNRQLRHIKVKFKANKVEGLKAYTDLVGFEVMKNYVARIIRRRKSKIETIIFGETTDKRKIKIKAITVTARKASVPKEKEIRKKMQAVIEKTLNESNYYELMNKIIKEELSNKIVKEIKDIFPIQRTEIISAELKA